MTEITSVHHDGANAARWAMEECVWEGGVAIFPSDTLYGLGCDPLSEAAVERINRIKGRDPGKSSAIMYFSPLAMRELLAGLGPRVREVAAALLPGPVTLVVANPERRYPLACRDDPERLGVRLIEGPLAGMHLAVFQTSANISGYSAPSSFDQVDPEIVEAADVAIDGGALAGSPSTVIDISRIDADGDWSILRQGAVERAEVGRVLGPIAG